MYVPLSWQQLARPTKGLGVSVLLWALQFKLWFMYVKANSTYSAHLASVALAEKGKTFYEVVKRKRREGHELRGVVIYL